MKILKRSLLVALILVGIGGSYLMGWMRSHTTISRAAYCMVRE